MLFNLLAKPLGNADFPHTQGIGDDGGMIADAVDDRLCAEFPQLFTGKILALTAAANTVTHSAVQKSMIGAILTSLADVVGKTAVTFVGKGRTGPAKQTAY